MLLRAFFWRQNIFQLVSIACILFIVLTVMAMLFYPGGTRINPRASGYSFLANFFSDLGSTRTPAGRLNTTSAWLFTTALTLAGAGLALFFVAFMQFFVQSIVGRLLSGLGSLSGILSGIYFISVAFTPLNLSSRTHFQFVLWSFRTFLLAVVLYAIVILQERQYPNRFALVFVVFAILLGLYLLLLTRGPSSGTPQGLIIQATGQKIIVYASIVSIFVQAQAARQVAQAMDRRDRDTIPLVSKLNPQRPTE